MLDSEPLITGPAPGGLHFVADENSPVLPDYVRHNREIFLRGRDEPADTLNRLSDESGNPPRRCGLDQVFHVLRAAHAAGWILQTKWATIAIGVVSVNDARLRHPQLPRALSRQAHGGHRAPVIAVAQCDNLGCSGIAARCQNGSLV